MTTRRDFIASGAAGIALLIGITETGCVRPSEGGSTPFAPNQWLRIDANGRVTVINDKSEMGQGSSAVIPLIVADELGVTMESVTVEHAQPGSTFNDMGTAGSDTVQSRWEPLRKAAAAAREMLIAAAAAEWGVAASECFTENGTVRRRDSRRSLPFGRLVAQAGALPVPESPALKPASELRLVGTK